MSSVFISYATEDLGKATEVRERLLERGIAPVFLSARNISIGTHWEQKLYTELRSCRAVIALNSRAFSTSNWCFVEVALARFLGKPLLPVRIEKSDLHELVRELQVVDLVGTTDELKRGYERLFDTLDSAGPANSEWDPARPPYPGLQSFEESDAPIFFGREQAIEDGLAHLRRLHRAAKPGWFLLLGASGSGKSSLLRAGILPRLKRESSRWIVVAPFTPGDEPMQQLALAFQRTFKQFGKTYNWVRLRRLLVKGKARALADLAGDLRAAAGRPEATILLAVDQLEELLTFGAGSPLHTRERATFARRIRTLSELPTRSFLIAATLRADFLGRFQSHTVFRELNSDPMVVYPVTKKDLPSVITGPAQLARVNVEAGLVDEILLDMGTEDALPLLAFTLRKLYEGYAETGVLDKKSYRALGGLGHAVERVAAQVTAEAAQTPKLRSHLRIALLSLVRLGENDLPVRRMAHWDELPPASHGILERFVEARLLVSSGTGTERELQAAHEAFFRSWPLLATWVREAKEVLEWRRKVAYLASDGRNVSLLSGATLNQASRFQNRGDWHYLSEAERNLIKRSQRHAWTKRAIAALAGVLILALGSGLIYQHIRERIVMTQEAELRRLDWLTTDALASRRGDRAARFALRIQSLRPSATTLKNAFSSALGVGDLGYVGEQRNPAPVLGVLPDDTVIAGDKWGWLRLWDKSHPGESRFLGVHSGVTSVGTLADGNVISAGHTGVTIWNCEKCVIQPPLLESPVVAIAPTSDGVWVLATTDGRLQLWKPPSRETEELGHHPGVTHLSTLGERRVASASGADGSVLLWQIGKNGEPYSVDAFAGVVAMARAGLEQLAVADSQGQTFLVSIREPSRKTRLGVHAGKISSLVALQQARIATGGFDGRILRWDRTTPGVPLPLGRCQSAVLALATLHDGSLVSLSADGRVNIWHGTRDEGPTLLAKYSKSIRVIEPLRDGRWLVGSEDGKLDVWEPSAHRALILGRHPKLWAASELPDGRIITGAADGGPLRIWDPRHPLTPEERSWPGNSVRAMVSLGAGQVAVADNHVIWAIDLELARPPRRIGSHSYVITALATLGDADIVSADSAGQVKKWSVQHHEQHEELARLGLAIEDLIVLEDGSLAFAGDAGDIEVINTGKGKMTLARHAVSIRALAAARGGQILSAGKNGRVQLWNRDRPEEPLELGWYGDTAMAVGSLPDGRALVGDNLGRLWLSGRFHLMDREHLMTLVKERLAQAHLTDDERSQLGLSPDE